jgi:hypothetical protein
MNKKNIEAKARSGSMLKWIGVFKEQFDLETEDGTPTEQMDDVIEQLNDLLSETPELLEEVDRFMRKTIIAWYKIGARRGIAEFINQLDETGLLDDDTFEVLPEKIEWSKALKYNSFDGDKKRIPSKKYKITIKG